MKTKRTPKPKNLASAIVNSKAFSLERRDEDQMNADGWAVFYLDTDVYEIEGLADGRFSSDDSAATKQMLEDAKAGNVTALKQLLFLMAKIAEPVIKASSKLGQHSCCEGIEDIQVTIPDGVAETAARAVF